jgi:peptidoglycan hydrolase-like protein with peptidoglycan-binding domain
MRRSLLIGGVGAVIIAATVLIVGGTVDLRSTAAPRPSGPATTVPIVRQTLTDTITISATIGYVSATPIQSHATGTVTWLPRVGATLRRGDTLFRANEMPTVILYGALPMYRPLAVGTSGPDVKQFEQNLRALGYTGFTVDQSFGGDTASAVRRWQLHLGLQQSGAVDVSQIIYLPGPVRVGEQLVAVGADAAGSLIKLTATAKVVTATVEAVDGDWAKPGAKVEVVLPDGTSTPGIVSASDHQEPTDAGGGSTVHITVAVANQTALRGTDVGVRYVADERKDVLTVPVAALLALPQGGYGLELADGRLVPVRTGLFADGQVEISGSGLTAGQAVGMPR